MSPGKERQLPLWISIETLPISLPNLQVFIALTRTCQGGKTTSGECEFVFSSTHSHKSLHNLISFGGHASVDAVRSTCPRRDSVLSRLIPVNITPLGLRVITRNRVLSERGLGNRGFNREVDLEYELVTEQKSQFIVRPISRDWRNPVQIWNFSDCCSADFGSRWFFNQLYNQKIEYLDDFASPCQSFKKKCC